VAVGVAVADEDPTRVLIRQVLWAVSQFEKSVIVAKLRAARMRRRQQTGRCEGRKRFGEHPVSGRCWSASVNSIESPRSGATQQQGDRSDAQRRGTAYEDGSAVAGGDTAENRASRKLRR
jgi:hypothetical protein